MPFPGASSKLYFVSGAMRSRRLGTVKPPGMRCRNLMRHQLIVFLPFPFGRGARGEGAKLSAKYFFDHPSCLSSTTLGKVGWLRPSPQPSAKGRGSQPKQIGRDSNDWPDIDGTPDALTLLGAN